MELYTWGLNNPTVLIIFAVIAVVVIVTYFSPPRTK